VDVRHVQVETHCIGIDRSDTSHEVSKRRRDAYDRGGFHHLLERKRHVRGADIPPVIVEGYVLSHVHDYSVAVSCRLPARGESRTDLACFRVDVDEIFVDGIEVQLARQTPVPGKERAVTERGHGNAQCPSPDTWLTRTAGGETSHQHRQRNASPACARIQQSSCTQHCSRPRGPASRLGRSIMADSPPGVLGAAPLLKRCRPYAVLPEGARRRASNPIIV